MPRKKISSRKPPVRKPRRTVKATARQTARVLEGGDIVRRRADPDPAPAGAPATPPAGESARITMKTTAAPAPAAPGAAEDPIAAPVAGTPPPLEDVARAKLEEVFSPEISAMILETAFGVAAVATGEPDIWQATDDEIEPLAPGLGRQLARIPVIRMIGPDNTEGGIVLLGIGVMVTRRLNEHAEKRQRERAAAAGAPSERRAAMRTVAAEPAGGERLEDGSIEPHFGMRA